MKKLVFLILIGVLSVTACNSVQATPKATNQGNSTTSATTIPGYAPPENPQITAPAGPQDAYAPPGQATPVPDNQVYPAMPTPGSVPALEPRCRKDGMKSYVNEPYKFCFAYPERFTIDESQSGKITLNGPALDQSAEPLHAWGWIEIRPANGDLAAETTAFIGQFQNVTLNQTDITLSGDPAKQLEPVPGQLSSQDLIVVHLNNFFHIGVSPFGEPKAQTDFNDLMNAFKDTFTFLN